MRIGVIVRIGASLLMALLAGLPAPEAQSRRLGDPEFRPFEGLRTVGMPDWDDEGSDEGPDCPGECAGAPAAVSKTGQTGCWDGFGNPTPCADTGQDGDYETGVSVEPRFSDNGDGTVTDLLTHLIWLKHASCFGPQYWADALSSANGLASGTCDLSDGSEPGDWRTPSINEILSLIDHGMLAERLPAGQPFVGVQETHWSSTTDFGSPDRAWVAIFDPAVPFLATSGVKTDPDDRSYVWPVRGCDPAAPAGPDLELISLENPPVVADSPVPGVCIREIQSWTALLGNVAPEGGSSPLDDILVDRVDIVYEPSTGLPPLPVGLGGVVVPANGTAPAVFEPITQADLAGFPDDEAASVLLGLTFVGQTFNGGPASVSTSAALAIEACDGTGEPEAILSLFANPSTAAPDLDLDPTGATYFSFLIAQLIDASTFMPLVGETVTFVSDAGNLRFNACEAGTCSLDGEVCPNGVVDCIQPPPAPVTVRTDVAGVATARLAVTADDPALISVEASALGAGAVAVIVNPLNDPN